MGWQDREYYQSGGSGTTTGMGFPKPTPLALGLIIACFAIFLLESVTAGPGRSILVQWGALTLEDGKAFIQPWRWVTYQYLHGGVFHIFFNCLGIYFFLPALERRWGPGQTFVFYTLGGVFAGVVFALMAAMAPAHMQPYLIGASGSVLAALGACALLFPEMQIVLLFFLVPIRFAAALFGILYLLLTFGERDLSGAAHLGGLAFGFFGPMLGGSTIGRLTHWWYIKRARKMAAAEHQEQEFVDMILEKVHDQGMHSLTWREKRILKRATERQRKRDMELTRRRIF